MSLGSRKNEDSVFRRFLQGLKQGIKGSFRKVMSLVYYINLVFSKGRRIGNILYYIPYLVHSVIGSRVYLHHIHAGGSRYCFAGGTLKAGISVLRVFTVYRLCEDLGHRGLSRSPCSAEKVGVADPSHCYLVFKRPYYGILTLYILKPLRTPFSV